MSRGYPKPTWAEFMDFGVKAPARPAALEERQEESPPTVDLASATANGVKCPMDELTDDILLEIMFILLSYVDPRSHHVHRSIMAVNRRWRELITRNPLCWTYVDIGSSIYPSVMSSFAHSGLTQLVDVAMDFSTMNAHNVSYQDACAVTMQHSSQIRSLEVLNLPHWMPFAHFLEIWKRNNITTPNLKTISITAKQRHRSSSDISLYAFPKYDNKWRGAEDVERLTLSSFNPFVLPHMRNLKFLEISVVGGPRYILSHIFAPCPQLDTLVIHQYDSPDLVHAPGQAPIIVPSLRHLAIGSSDLMMEGFHNDFFFVQTPNLESLEILSYQYWLKFSEPFLLSLSKLQRLRIHEYDRMDTVFLDWLPPRVAVEIMRMPIASFYVSYLFRVTNVERMIFHFDTKIYRSEARATVGEIWEVVRALNLTSRCPTVMMVPPGDEPSSDVLAILGDNFVMQAPGKWEPWLLGDGDRNYRIKRAK